MGQCKSKVTVLDDSGNEALGSKDCKEPPGNKAKKNKRKWRKSKGYSLSASLEGELNCDSDNVSLSKLSKLQGFQGSGPILVSYNVSEEEKKEKDIQRRNSFHHEDNNLTKLDPFQNTGAIETNRNKDIVALSIINDEKIDKTCMKVKKAAPIAEPESSSSSCTTSPFRIVASPSLNYEIPFEAASSSLPLEQEVNLQEIYKNPSLRSPNTPVFPPDAYSESINYDEVEFCLRNAPSSSKNDSVTLPQRVPNDSPPLMEIKNVSPIKYHTNIVDISPNKYHENVIIVDPIKNQEVTFNVSPNAHHENTTKCHETTINVSPIEQHETVISVSPIKHHETSFAEPRFKQHESIISVSPTEQNKMTVEGPNNLNKDISNSMYSDNKDMSANQLHVATTVSAAASSTLLTDQLLTDGHVAIKAESPAPHKLKPTLEETNQEQPKKPSVDVVNDQINVNASGHSHESKVTFREPSPKSEKKSSIVLVNNQSRVNIPVPSQISAILEAGSAPAFLNFNIENNADETYFTGEEEDEADDIADEIVEPPINFSIQPPAKSTKSEPDTYSSSETNESTGKVEGSQVHVSCNGEIWDEKSKGSSQEGSHGACSTRMEMQIGEMRGNHTQPSLDIQINDHGTQVIEINKTSSLKNKSQPIIGDGLDDLQHKFDTNGENGERRNSPADMKPKVEAKPTARHDSPSDLLGFQYTASYPNKEVKHAAAPGTKHVTFCQNNEPEILPNGSRSFGEHANGDHEILADMETRMNKTRGEAKRDMLHDKLSEGQIAPQNNVIDLRKKYEEQISTPSPITVRTSSAPRPQENKSITPQQDKGTEIKEELPITADVGCVLEDNKEFPGDMSEGCDDTRDIKALSSHGENELDDAIKVNVHDKRSDNSDLNGCYLSDEGEQQGISQIDNTDEVWEKDEKSDYFRCRINIDLL